MNFSNFFRKHDLVKFWNHLTLLECPKGSTILTARACTKMVSKIYVTAGLLVWPQKLYLYCAAASAKDVLIFLLLFNSSLRPLRKVTREW